MTKTYYVATTHNGATTYLQLNRQKPLKVKAKANTKYLIYADDGTFVYNVHLKAAGDDVHVYLPQDNKAILTIEDYKDFVEISDSNTLFMNNSTLMLTHEVSNAVIATPTPSPIIASIGTKTSTSIAATSAKAVGTKKASTWALAGLGLVGAGVALAGGKDKDGGSHSSPSEPKPTITINPITDDNIINIKESQSIITITGTVNNAKNGDILNLKIGSTNQTVTIKNGAFNINLDGKTLVAHKEIIAEITRNGQIISSEKHIYSIDTQIETPTININPITGDNVIDQTEAKGKITVTGNVTNAKDGDEVIVSCGCPTCSGIKWIDIKTTVTGGTFSVDFNGSDMVANNGNNIVKATVTTSDTAKNTATATAEQDYKVVINSNPKTDTQAQIYLDDVHLDLAKEIGSVRLSGKLNFNDSIFNQNLNKHFLQGLILKIGNKEFIVGINQQDYSFFVDLSQEQYQELKGQDISHKFIAYTNIIMPYITPENKWHQDSDLITYETKENGIKEYGVISLKSEEGKQELAKVTLDFHDKNIDASRQLKPVSSDKTSLNGNIVGGKVGDEVVIEIGSKKYYTKVQDDQRFSLEVENNDLKNITNIRAILKTKDNNSNIIDVYDSAKIIRPNSISDEFVNQHELIEPKDRIIKHSDPNYNFAYFIHANTPYGHHTGGFLNKLLSAKNGGDEVFTIKYYFSTKDDFEKGLVDEHIYRWWAPHTKVVDHTPEFKQLARKIYDEFSSYVNNIEFIETTKLDEADTVLSVGDLSTGGGGFAGYGGNMVLFPPDGNGYIGGGKHEILHTLGADHTGDILHHLDYAKHEITGEVSYMSNVDGFKIYSERLSYGIFDLAYFHYRFGVNKNHNSGNNTYSFQNYTATTPDTGIYIWDGGGVDTFDASQEKEGVNVNLTPGSWIYRGEISDTFLIKNKTRVDEVWKEYIPFLTSQGLTISPYDHKIEYVTGQAFIGYGTQLENLIGSNYADTLKGNKADNNIFGGAGNDSIDGDDGNDYLDGGQGVDILTGGRGNDIFVVDDNDDVVIERTSQGTDTIYSFADNYTLPSNVEHISLFATAQNATGNELSNTMIGNDLDNQLIGGLGNDTLSGGRGNDILIGGSGSDTFVFDDLLDGSIDHIIDFNPSDDKIALSSAIFNNLTQSNIQDHIKYDKDTGYLSYHYDNSAIHFATLTARLNGDLINYQII